MQQHFLKQITKNKTISTIGHRGWFMWAAILSPSSSLLASAFITTKPFLPLSPAVSLPSSSSSSWSKSLFHCKDTSSILHSQNNFYHNDSNSDGYNNNTPSIKRFDKIQVEVTRFGRLGASVGIIAVGSHNEDDCIPEDEEFLGQGLILQSEIQYFRAARDGLDVVVGEILPAYVENVREDGKIDISLRDPGGKGKATSVGKAIIDKLKSQPGGIVHVGDKSSPSEINAAFPGTSKGAFKKAVAALYKRGLVQPGPHSITLMNKKE